MNPSAAAWIPKFLNLFDRDELFGAFENEQAFYSRLKETGFLYGLSYRALPQSPLSPLKLTKEEYAKVNLFHALLFSYFQFSPKATDEEAISALVGFYKDLGKMEKGFLPKFSLASSPVAKLEGILAARVQDSNSFLRRNTLAMLTNALLFVDVLSFVEWVQNPVSAKKSTKEIENEVMRNCYRTMKAKLKKNKYDLLLIDLFEASDFYEIEKSQEKQTAIGNFWLKHYILDLCCLTIWEDFLLDESERIFLENLTKSLELPETALQNSLLSLKDFSEKYKKKLHLFEFAHPVKKFYKQGAATVKLLILRNKDRLLKELSQSGELLLLLSQSTTRNLNSDEKKRVREQLLDICKSIPSLTIFLLPGGGVLLPLLVKFIPKLLPSAFQDNRIEK